MQSKKDYMKLVENLYEEPDEYYKEAARSIVELHDELDKLPDDSMLMNCTLHPRQSNNEDEYMFWSGDVAGKTVILAHLDGYAIIPSEKYRCLLNDAQ